MKSNLAHKPPQPQGEVVLFPKQERQVMSSKTVTYREKLLEQKVRLFELAIKANLANPSLENAVNVAKARYELFDFLRGVQ